MSGPSPLFFRSLSLLLLLAFAATITLQAQTDVSLSAYGAFNGRTEGNGTVQSPSNQGGGMIELRRIRNPLVGYDLNYSFNRANQSFNFTSVKADAHEVGVAWVVSIPLPVVRPFALAGIGGIFFHPDSPQPGEVNEVKLVYVYGAGLDWSVIPHFGIRFQYRGNLYHAPDLLKTVASTDAFTQTSEPMLGAYFRF